MVFFVNLLVGLALMVLVYIIMPKPKQNSPEIKDLEDPVAEAGKPGPVLFGTKTIKGLNILWFGDKSYRKVKIKA